MSIEVMRHVLEVFGGGDWHEESVSSAWADKANQAIEALRQAIKQADQSAKTDTNAHPEYLRGYAEASKHFGPESKQAQKQEPKCNPHPKAPHGFNRNGSHANDRYTCDCESWDAYEAGYQAGVIAGIEASMSEEQEQEPVAWLNRDSVDGFWYPNAFKTDNLESSIPLYTSPPHRQLLSKKQND